jgi:hypothetical protein
VIDHRDLSQLVLTSSSLFLTLSFFTILLIAFINIGFPCSILVHPMFVHQNVKRLFCIFRNNSKLAQAKQRLAPSHWFNFIFMEEIHTCCSNTYLSAVWTNIALRAPSSLMCFKLKWGLIDIFLPHYHAFRVQSQEQGYHTWCANPKASVSDSSCGYGVHPRVSPSRRYRSSIRSLAASGQPRRWIGSIGGRAFLVTVTVSRISRKASRVCSFSAGSCFGAINRKYKAGRH